MQRIKVASSGEEDQNAPCLTRERGWVRRGGGRGGKGSQESGLEQKGGRQEKVEDGCQDGAQGAVRENKQMGALRIFYLKLSPVEYKYGGG